MGTAIKHSVIMILIMVFFATMPLPAQCREGSGGGKFIHIKFGFPSSLFEGFDRKDVKAALEVWARELGKKAEDTYVTEVDMYDDISSISRDLVKERIDLLVLFMTDYFRLREKNLIEPIAVPVIKDNPYLQFVVLVNEQSGISKLKQMKHRHINRLKGYGDIDGMWLDTVLMRQRLPVSSRFFKTVKQTDNASQTVLPVYFKQADGCLVSSYGFSTMVELNPSIGKKLITVEESPRILPAAFFIRKSCSEKMKQDGTRLITTLGSDEAGKQILTLFKIQRMLPYRPEYMENVRKLYEEYCTLRKTPGLK